MATVHRPLPRSCIRPYTSEVCGCRLAWCYRLKCLVAKALASSAGRLGFKSPSSYQRLTNWYSNGYSAKHLELWVNATARYVARDLHFWSKKSPQLIPSIFFSREANSIPQFVVNLFCVSKAIPGVLQVCGRLSELALSAAVCSAVFAAGRALGAGGGNIAAPDRRCCGPSALSVVFGACDDRAR